MLILRPDLGRCQQIKRRLSCNYFHRRWNKLTNCARSSDRPQAVKYARTRRARRFRR
jgi:hypothetical protein